MFQKQHVLTDRSIIVSRNHADTEHNSIIMIVNNTIAQKRTFNAKRILMQIESISKQISIDSSCLQLYFLIISFTIAQFDAIFPSLIYAISNYIFLELPWNWGDYTVIINYDTSHSDFITRRSSRPRFALITTRVFTRRFVSAMRLDRRGAIERRIVARDWSQIPRRVSRFESAAR